MKFDAVIAEVEEAIADEDDAREEQAWMRLSFVDAMVLNASRSPGESQAQAVARRIRQAIDDEWEALWKEATSKAVRRGPSPDMTEAERAAATASRVEDLAHAHQARRAARAVNPPAPAVTDSERLEELRALFPRAEGAPVLPVAGVPAAATQSIQKAKKIVI